MLATQEEDITLSRVFGAIRRHKRRIAFLVMAFTLLAAGLVMLLPPAYTASVSLVLGDARPVSVRLGDAVKDQPLDRFTSRTQAAILTSRDLAETVAEKLALDQHPDFTALPSHEARVDAFLKNLSVTASDQSYVLQLAYHAKDKDFALQAAETVAENYIAGQQRFRQEAIHNASGWLESRVAKARTEAAEAENRRQRAEQAMQLERIEQALALPQGAAALPAELSSPRLEDLRREEAERNAALSALQTSYREGHPKMKIARAELAALRQRMNDEAHAIAANLRQSLERSGGMETISTAAYKSLASEAETKQALYQGLLTRQQELGVEDAGSGMADARIISRATVKPDFLTGQKLLLIVAALLLSFVAVTGVMILLEFAMPGFHTGSQLEAQLGVPVLSLLPEVARGPDAVSPLNYINDAYYGEAIRTVRMKLDRMRTKDRTGRVVLITSSVPEEGKSSAALALALSAQASGRSCLLVDCDLRQPQLAKTLEKPDVHGLGGYLSGSEVLEDILRKDKGTGLHFISAGRAPAHPLDLLESPRLGNLLIELRAQFDLVILDSPPLMSVSDAALLAAEADLSLYLVRWEKTDRATVAHGIELLCQHGAKERIAALLSRVDVEKHALYRHADASYVYFRRYRQSDAA